MWGFVELDADIVFLCECGEVVYGLGDEWTAILKNVCPDRIDHINHDSHYTALIDTNLLNIEKGPYLKGPMLQLQGHNFRMCQYVKVSIRNSAAKPIEVFNIHNPSSGGIIQDARSGAK